MKRARPDRGLPGAPAPAGPTTARLVFVLDVAGTRYTGHGRGWLMPEHEPGRYSAVGRVPVPGEYPAVQILAWDEVEAVTKPNG